MARDFQGPRTVEYTEEYLAQQEARRALLEESRRPQALAPSGLPIADITIAPAADAFDQAAIEAAAAEGRIPVTPIWMTDTFFTALLFLAGGYGAAWFARRQRWV